MYSHHVYYVSESEIMVFVTFLIRLNSTIVFFHSIPHLLIMRIMKCIASLISSLVSNKRMITSYLNLLLLCIFHLPKQNLTLSVILLAQLHFAAVISGQFINGVFSLLLILFILLVQMSCPEPFFSSKIV